MRVPFVAGNWKMNKTPSEAAKLAMDLRHLTASVRGVEIAVAPTAVCLGTVAKKLEDSNIKLAAQNLYWEASGAFTGEISGSMLKDIGCSHVIIGHSERRQYFGESDETVAKRVRAAFDNDLLPIVCIGELLAERESGKTFEVVERQLLGGLVGVKDDEASSLVVAYEPVWAIGTGRTASPEQAQEVHAFLRGKLSQRFGTEAANAIRIQYGGSVTAANAKILLSQPDIDGALVGGASLKPESFIEIIRGALA
ncbi:MAG: triose-phosphate isomerase [Myxococcota bacterium]|jgi:triosephosphate isomerase|nr:triose-phosphate isomerase [Myxococcota bacterium]